MSSSFNVKKEEKGRNIQVVVRCRPFNTAERKPGSHSVVECDNARRELNVRTGGIGDKSARKTYTFDMVFGPSAKQIEVYRSVVCPILDEVIMGYNCTVFAYGQTGTGKTFTMEGERSANEEFTWEADPLAGIIPRTLHQIFEKLSNNGTEFSVKVSLLEIYNEELFDLLSPSPDVTERLQMFDDPRNKRGVIIKGLEEITVHNKDEVYQILERGSAKRKTASTLMNAYSSRSHSVFSVTIHMKETTIDGEELVKIGKLNLVDLAGSENIGRSGAVDKRAREAGNINQSLLTLGRVITALVERAPHVPYRESKLTRILQDSLGGRTKTSIIATISPASINLEETLSTLEYANRAKNIMNKPEVNQKLTKRALIKEYTEEIERLKRDLAASRDKNGVYLSSENFDSMNGKIAVQEEQIGEFTEKISALDEELKRLTELFSDSKRELEQCSNSLNDVKLQLDEAQTDLQDTKQRLSVEQFVVSELETTEEKLFSTAEKLLTTADVSTRDVSGLHEKLDRKKAVDEHNAQMQKGFGNQMDTIFNQMQTSVNEQRAKHQDVFGFYKSSVASLLDVSATAFSEATSTVTTSFKSIGDLVGASVTKCVVEMEEQESLCQEGKDRMKHILEEHRHEMEEGIFAVILPSLTALMEMHEALKRSLQDHSAVAEKMESMKREMSSFFTDHTQALARLRGTADAGFSSLLAENEKLKQKMSSTGKKHEASVAQVISCLQNQLSLLALETKTDLGELLAQSEAVQGPVASLQKDIQTQCTAAEKGAVAQRGHADAASDSLAADLRRAAEEAEQTLEECSGQHGYLKTAVTRLGQQSLVWCDTAQATAASLAEEQLSKMASCKTSAQALQKDVEAGCEGAARGASEQLKLQQSAVQETLEVLEKQISSDEAALQLYSAELASHPCRGLSKVRAFLHEELAHDVPTGRTPQRKDYVYPRTLARSRRREELLESFSKQQELQAAQSLCEAVQEEQVDEVRREEQMEEDSLQEEVSSCNDTTIPELSYVDENVMCYESQRGPFFKRKRGGKKDKSSLDHSKTTENERESPVRSKLPLRVQN
ncbi:kinesin-like protein KIF11 isoform X1 [Conger conger]|nr:kinesin-like protein KIF11 isoform X1 [Conger conger]